jgi:hypothetical protein
MNKEDKRKQQHTKANMMILNHISRKNCALLPYLSDESLHTLGEFIFNVITQQIELDNVQLKKVKRILKKDKTFYKKLINVNTKDPLGYFRNRSAGWKWYCFLVCSISPNYIITVISLIFIQTVTHTR